MFLKNKIQGEKRILTHSDINALFHSFMCALSVLEQLFPPIARNLRGHTYHPVSYYLSQAFHLFDTKLAELRVTDKQEAEQNTSKCITHLNLLRIHLSKYNYATVAANYYQISYNKSGAFT